MILFMFISLPIVAIFVLAYFTDRATYAPVPIDPNAFRPWTVWQAMAYVNFAEYHDGLVASGLESKKARISALNAFYGRRKNIPCGVVHKGKEED